jgi:protein glucosyltransferase
MKSAKSNFKNSFAPSTLARDLAPFHGGINRTHIESVVTDPHMRAVKYQIINHRLYRSTDCMFEARCEGIEYFLHKLIDELPNMEFALNTRDFPLVNRFQGLKAVFSFSKVCEIN